MVKMLKMKGFCGTALHRKLSRLFVSEVSIEATAGKMVDIIIVCYHLCHRKYPLTANKQLLHLNVLVFCFYAIIDRPVMYTNTVVYIIISYIYCIFVIFFTSFGWGKGGKVTAATWQVTLCIPIWDVISCSGVMILIMDCYIRFTLPFTYL